MTILYPPPRPQSVGEILDLAFRIFGATLIKCLPYSLAGVIAGELPTMYDVATGHSLAQATLNPSGRGPLWWPLVALAVFLTLMLSNAVLLRQYALATGHPVATGAELATGARRVPGMVLIILLLTLAVLVTFIPVALIAVQLLGLSAPTTLTPAFLRLLVGAYVLLLVCASWVVARWICSGAVYLLTDRGPVASMRQSWLLTSGSFWRLTAIYAVGLVLIIVLYFLASIIAGVMAILLAHGDLAVITATWVVVLALLGALITPMYSGLILAVFGDLSVRREGADLERRMSAPTPS